MKIILVSYINRSGSTFLLSRLNSTSKVISCPEANILVRFLLRIPSGTIKPDQLNKLTQYLTSNHKFRHWRLTPPQVTEALNEPNNFLVFYKILESYKNNIKPEAQIVAFKSTEIMKFARAIYETSITTKHDIEFLLLIRDPRAIFSSQYNTYIPRLKKYMNKSILLTISQWNKFVHLSNTLKDQSHFSIIKYEKILSDNVLNICGIEINLIKRPNSIDYFNLLPENEKMMHINIIEEPMPDRINAWQASLNISQIQLIEFFCREGMLELAYDITSNHRDIRSKLLLIREVIYFIPYSLINHLFRLFFRTYIIENE
jgi:hypothetical protein